MKVYGSGPRTQGIAVCRPQNGAATSRQHRGAVSRELVEDLLLKIAERRLALALEKFAYRATYALLYNLIRIDKIDVKPPGELPADSRFTRPW